MITRFQKQLQKENPCTDHLVMATSFEDMKDIGLKGKNLAIFPRTMDLKLESFLHSIDLFTFPDIQTSFYFYECQKQLELLLKGITTDTDGLYLFIKDISQSVHQFCQLMNTELIRFNLQVIDNDMCRYFHCDYNNIRLLCTYLGEGTQWLANNNVNRDKLGCKNNAEIIIDPTQVHELSTYWIGLFKGEIFKGNAGNGIIHRSPSVKEISKKRILLRLDT